MTGLSSDSVILADSRDKFQYKYMADFLRLDVRRPQVPTSLPQQLSQLNTPLQWQECCYLVEGTKEGFRIGFSGEAKGLGQRSTRNMLSAREHSGMVDDYLADECCKGRVLGPLKQEFFPQVHPNRFGVITKGTSSRWRLIVDMSFPAGLLGK